MQKKMEMGKVMTMRMMEMVFSRREQQSKPSSGSLDSLSFIVTILRENHIISEENKRNVAVGYLVLGRHFRFVLFSYLLLDNN